MVQLPGGTFRMGSSSLEKRNEEGPVREVTVKPFAIDKYPVTNRDFSLPLGGCPSRRLFGDSPQVLAPA